MCGIVGFCNFKISFQDNTERWNKVLVNMRTAIRRRGPDSTGEYLKEHVGLSHTRLSIRDVEGGIQPMVREKYAIVYNGEIYNTDELKQNLSCFFETTSDTEVILNGYIEQGLNFIKKLNGIFAFAIWDGERLVLCRDHVGTKPLFYTIKDNTIIFGSEPKALFAHPDITPEIDTNSLREIFGIGPARTAGNGVFKDVHEILPGHYNIFSRDGIKSVKYWSLESRPHEDNYDETLERTSFLVTDAIRHQMVSDVPICSLLSGGVDSSIITAVASKFLAESGKVLNTFSFDFKGNDEFFTANAFQPERDRPFVDKMLEKYSLNHTYLECDEEELADLLYDAVDAKDLPGMSDIDASLIYFCKLVKKHNKVALTGECADEIFAGYPWFYRENLMSAGTFPWSKDMKTRKMLLSEDFLAELNLDEYTQNRYHESLSEVPKLEGEAPQEARRREIAYLNIQWFMQTLLTRMDRASMYSGLEARVPFADHRIIEYIWNVPWDMKCKDGVVKSLLREAFQGLLPPELLNRKKSPYPKTYNPNYTRILKERLLTITNDTSSPILPLIDIEKVRKFAESSQELGKPWFGQLMAGPQLMAYLIQVDYWMRKYGITYCS